MIKLDTSERHFWEPDPRIIKALCDLIPQGAKVLEIGPGATPFPRAQVLVDIKDFGKGLKTVNCDCNTERLPFKDKEFDFIYARHVLEDMWNPFNLMKEASRVAKSGYFETPSPLCEFSRGVDAGETQWRGYNHHFWLIWPHKGVLNFLGKFPLIEFVSGAEEDNLKLLRSGHRMWNTSFHWVGEAKFKHVQCPQDYHLPHQYPGAILTAIEEWKAAA